MRYIPIDDITFTDANGTSYNIKDTRPIPSYTTRFVQQVTVKDRVDEIAGRDEAFGDGGEADAWKIYDYNILPLLEHCFVLGTAVKELKIPR